MSEEQNTFPGEEVVVDEQGKWSVATSSGESLKIIAAGFKLMTEADAWIRENIEEGQVLVPVRLGSPKKLEVARRIVEADL